jgi:hypothetical protein
MILRQFLHTEPAISLRRQLAELLVHPNHGFLENVVGVGSALAIPRALRGAAHSPLGET